MELAQNVKTEAPARRAWVTASTMSAILAGLAISVGVFLTARQYERREVRMEFEREVSSRVAAIQLELDENLWLLAAVRAVWDGTGGLDRAQFGQMVRPLLEQYSAVTALEWVPVVRDEDRERGAHAQHERDHEDRQSDHRGRRSDQDPSPPARGRDRVESHRATERRRWAWGVTDGMRGESTAGGRVRPAHFSRRWYRSR